MILLARKGDIHGDMPLCCFNCSEYRHNKCKSIGVECESYMHRPKWCPILTVIPEKSDEVDDKIQWRGITNGDIIKAMFPNEQWHYSYDDYDNLASVESSDSSLDIEADWWNAEYRREK